MGSAAKRMARRQQPDLDLLRSKAVIESARDAILSIDAHGLITHFNRAAEEMFGYGAEEVIGRNVSMLMPSPYRDEHDSYLASYQRTGEAKAIGRIREVEARRKDGNVFPIELSVSEIRTGRAPAYNAIIRDVSAFRSMLEELRRERDFRDRLIDTVPMMVIVLDCEARIVRYNRYMEEVTGFELAEMQGKSVEAFVPRQEHETLRDRFMRTLDGDPQYGVLLRQHTRSGEDRIVKWSSHQLRGTDGEIAGVLAAGEDITERSRVEAEFRRLEQISREQERLADIGAIAARLVHDLANPLSGITMQAQLLVRRLGKQSEHDGELVEPARKIVAAVASLNELIRSFMDFARERRLELKQVDLQALLAEIIGLWEPIAASSDVEIELAANDAGLVVIADASKLRRVFDNLIKNAIEAVDSDGRVVVGLEAFDGDHVRVSVRDDGPGVPAGIDAFRLFETTKPNGSGVGLAIARQMVSAHAGSIYYTNLEPRGTCFNVELLRRGPHA